MNRECEMACQVAHHNHILLSACEMANKDGSTIQLQTVGEHEKLSSSTICWPKYSIITKPFQHSLKTRTPADAAIINTLLESEMLSVQRYESVPNGLSVLCLLHANLKKHK
jgi:hypothetical protein